MISLRGLKWMAVFLALSTVPAFAFTTNYWTNTNGGNWETTANWSQGSVPDFDDFVRITNAGTYTVTVGNTAADTVPNSFTNTQIDVISPSLTARPTLTFDYTNAINFVTTTNTSSGGLRIGNAIVNWNAPNAVFTIGGIFGMNNGVGYGTNGEFNILAGRVNATRLSIGSVSGANSTINIYTGGVFAFTSGDSRLGVHAGALGQINIRGGTMVWSNGMFIGHNANATGRVVLAEGEIQIMGAAGAMEIGSGTTQSSQDGYGQVIISNGLLTSSGTIRVGAGPRARGEMFIYGGTITNNGTFTVGEGTGIAPQGSTTGTVLMTGGNFITYNTIRFGRSSNTLGRFTMTGGNFVINYGNQFLSLGDVTDAAGEFNMQGGTFSVSSNLSRIALGVASNSFGTLNVSGGLMDLSKTTTGIIVGSNAFSTARMNLDGGLVRLTTLNVTSAGILSNRTGGVLQFVGSDTVQGPGTANRIVDGGTLSYRNYHALTVSVAAAKFNIVSGSILQLESSTNANITGTYSLADSAGNFKELSLTGTNTKWNSDALLVDAGTRLRVTNAVTARTSATITNLGTILVENSTMTYEKKVVISGRYISDPSTNTFNDDATLSLSGTLEGGVGDLFDFKKNLIINSTNSHGFDLLSSTVLSSGGGNHTNAITGDDVGTNGLGHIFNFGYGSLRLGSVTDHVYFASGNAAPSNALYVYFLDMLGATDGDKLSLATNNLHTLTPNINVYYAVSNLVEANAYLQDLTWALPGGGFLIPATVPEPGLALLFGTALLALLRRRRS